MYWITNEEVCVLVLALILFSFDLPKAIWLVEKEEEEQLKWEGEDGGKEVFEGKELWVVG